MSNNRLIVGALLWLGAVTPVLQAAENVVVLPGAGSSATQITVYTASPFQVQNTITNQSFGAFLLLAKPDGSKNYIVSNVGGSSVSVYDGNFNNGHIISGALSLAPTAAGISPDGHWLVVLAGGIYVFDTTTDSLVTISGTPPTGSFIDVAFAMDSSKAFVLNSSGSTSTVTPVNLQSNTIEAPLALPSSTTGIALGPNGLLYVSGLNALFEIEPRTFTRTPSGTIGVNANLAKPVFTPDGLYAIATNRTTITGQTFVFFDLTKHALAGSADRHYIRDGTTLDDRLIVAGPNLVLAHSSTTNQLYDIAIQSGEATINTSSLLGALPSAGTSTVVGSVTVSNESPARFAYLIATYNGVNYLYKIDRSSLSAPGQFSIPSATGQVVSYVNSNPTSGGTTITAYNANQVVQPGALSLPLVARVQDSLGRPVNGARVDFTTAAGNLTASTATTNSDGYAETYLTAPTTPGAIALTAASAGTPGASYTVTVPGSIGGGGPGTSNLAAITIVSGNGQILDNQSPTSQNLVVMLTDSSGNPAPGQAVRFSITQGGGTIPGYGTTFDTVTDANGQASIPFTATSVDLNHSYQQTTINASSAIGSVNFIITTVARTTDGTATLEAGANLLAPELTISGRVISGGAGSVIKGAIQVQVQAVAGPDTGLGIPNVGLNVGPVTGDDPKKVPSATCINQPLSDANGIVSCDLLLGNVIGLNSIAVNVGGFRDISGILVNITTGPPTTITKTSGDAQSGPTGKALPQPLRVHVTDSLKNSLPNIPLKWTVTQGTATLSSTDTQTDASGNGGTTVTFGSVAGTVVITATAGTGTSAITATFNLTVTSNAGSIQVVSGDAQSTSTGQAFALPLLVLVKDAQGQPLPGAAVTWTVASGSATLSKTSTTSDGLGQSSITATAGSAAGAIVINATVGSSSATFNLTANLPGPPVNTASFVNAASGAAGLTPCGIALAQGSNLVPGVQNVVEANMYIGPLPTSLAGASLSVNGVPAPIFWVTNGAIAFQTPCETQAGTATVVVTISGGSTTVQGVNVTATQPGLFETVYNGKKYAVLLHADGSYVTPASPAARGEQLKMFATGLGTVTTPTATGRAGTGGQTVDASITVGVNNGGVRLISAEYLAGAVGLYVVTFEVPADTQTGTYQNLALAVAGPGGNLIFGNGSFVPIQ